jgi:hypothetical protein
MKHQFREKSTENELDSHNRLRLSNHYLSLDKHFKIQQ